jgi:hypothetical protein
MRRVTKSEVDVDQECDTTSQTRETKMIRDRIIYICLTKIQIQIQILEAVE